MTYEILRFHECFWGLLCWACWLGTLAWLVERNGFAEHEFGCVQLTTHRHYTSVYNTVSFFVYNITTIILRIFFIWINRGQLLDFWSMRLCFTCATQVVQVWWRHWDDWLCVPWRAVFEPWQPEERWWSFQPYDIASTFEVYMMYLYSIWLVIVYIYTAHKYTFYTVWLFVFYFCGHEGY